MPASASGWPAETTARLVQSQLAEDGTYPGAEAIFAAGVDRRSEAETQATSEAPSCVMADFDPNQPRDPQGRWMGGGGSNGGKLSAPVGGSGQAPHGPVGDPETSPDRNGPRAPDGMPIEQVALRGRSRAGAIGALLSAAARLARRLIGSPDTNEPEPPAAGPPPSGSVRFGNNPNQGRHAFRHIEDAGLDHNAVADAIENDLSSRSGTLPEGLYQGSIVVDGRRIDYNAYKFSNGGINVGRITLP